MELGFGCKIENIRAMMAYNALGCLYLDFFCPAVSEARFVEFDEIKILSATPHTFV